MTTQALKAVTSGQVTKPTTFPAMLEAYKGEIARALPKHLSPDRLARIAMTEFRKNPKLGDCDPRSVFAAVIQASQLGLEPGLMGQAYLIPYKTECQLIPGYQGLIDLVRRTGMVKRIEAHVVRDGDKFQYRTGMTTTLEHEPALDGDPGTLRLAYAVAEFTGGGYHVEVMTRAQIETIRNRSQGYQMSKRFNKPGPWDTDTEEMWRKTVIRRICKYLPKSAELVTALSLDDTAEHGAQHLTTKDAIEGTWMPTVEDEQADVAQAVEAAPAREEKVATVEHIDGNQITDEAAPAKDDAVPWAWGKSEAALKYPDILHELEQFQGLSEFARYIGNLPAKLKKELHAELEHTQARIRACMPPDGSVQS